MAPNESAQHEEIVLCSECFHDEGLKHGALIFGTLANTECPACGSVKGCKLNREAASQLAHRFFTWGSTHRTTYGAAPLIVSNQQHETDIELADWSGNDLQLFEEKLGLRFFLYGPRLWMVGEVEPLKALQAEATRPGMISRIIAEYPSVEIGPNEHFFRVRKAPKDPEDITEYDAPPQNLAGTGRLESHELPITLLFKGLGDMRARMPPYSIGRRICSHIGSDDTITFIRPDTPASRRRCV